MQVTFTTPDGGEITVSRPMAELSLLALRMLEMFDCTSPLSEAIPLPLVDKNTLELIGNWMELKISLSHEDSSNTGREVGSCISNEDDSLTANERSFFRALRRKQLHALLNAGNYMEIPSLVDSGTSYITDCILGMNAEETHKFLGMKNDFNSEERNQLKQKYSWLEHF